MQLKISKNNSKIGKIPNLSLTPGTSCVPEIPCYREGCYARNSYNRFPATKKAWDSNLELWNSDSGQFFTDWDRWLTKHRPERFRIFVGGDFPSQSFYFMVKFLAETHQETSFLAFTKRYNYIYETKPDNLQIVLSTWPGVPLPSNRGLPWSWLKEDDRRPEVDCYVCQGGCTDCGFQCWNKLDADTHVVFKKH